jgi:hypothetical protein
LKVKVSVAAIVATLLLAGTASAGYQVEFGFAKRAISRETASICARATGCKSWSVKPCRRQSWHRIDCLANFFFPQGASCHQVMIAVWPPWSDHLLLHHKRIIC